VSASANAPEPIQYWLPGVGKRAARPLRVPPEAEPVAEDFHDHSRTATADGSPVPVYVDDALALGRQFTNTSKRRWTRPPNVRPILVLYLAPGRERDAYVVAHELAHNVLYCQGLPRVDLARDAQEEELRLLLSSLSSATSHFLVNRLLRERGFDVPTREADRAERFLEGLPRRRAAVPARTALHWTDLVFHTPENMARRLRASASSVTDVFAERASEFERLVRESGLHDVPSIDSVQHVRRALLARLGIEHRAAMSNPLLAPPTAQEKGEAISHAPQSPSN